MEAYSSSSGMEPEHVDDALEAGEDTEQAPETSILQFSAEIFYVSEVEMKIEIDVVRLGNKRGTCKVDYYTKEASAMPGVKYRETKGTLTFLDEQSSAVIPVEIIEDSKFDTTLDFSVHLANPEDAELGLYLHKCRVKISDDDTFPTNKYRDQLRAHREHEISPWGLFKEYVIMNLGNPVVRRGTIKSLIVDQLDTLNYIWKVLLMIFLVDEVLLAHSQPEGGEDVSADVAGEGEAQGDSCSRRLAKNVGFGINARKQDYFLVAFLYLLPMVVLHFSDIRQCFFKVGGTSRKVLQENLVRRFLHYDEASRQRISTSDFSMAILRDANELVANGYMKIFAFFQQIGKLIIILCYQMVTGALMSSDYLSLLVLAVMPVMVLIFLRLRAPTIRRLKHEQALNQNGLAHQAKEITDAYRLIADYHERPYVVGRFSKQLAKYNNSTKKNAVCHTNNMYFIPWMTSAAVILWIIAASPKVQSGEMGLGQFMANLGIINGYGSVIKDLYNTILTIESAFSSLFRIIFYMNLPVDVPKRLHASRQRHKRGQEERATIIADSKKAVHDESPMKGNVSNILYAIDHVPIEIKLLSFAYSKVTSQARAAFRKLQHTDTRGLEDIKETKKETKEQKVKAADQEDEASAIIRKSLQGLEGSLDDRLQNPLFTCGSITIPQGSMVAIAGLHGVGKKSLLQLLGDVLLPDAGECFIPPHLRVLHVQDPLILEESLRENLIFGSRHNEDMGRTRRICERLGFSAEMLDLLDDDETSNNLLANQGALLSASDRHLINIARALIYNPEVLVVHKPGHGLDSEKRPRLMKILREYVDQRGFEMDPTTQHRRRPRTCFYSSTDKLEMEAQRADILLLIEDKKLSRFVPRGTSNLDVDFDSSSESTKPSSHRGHMCTVFEEPMEGESEQQEKLMAALADVTVTVAEGAEEPDSFTPENLAPVFPYPPSDARGSPGSESVTTTSPPLAPEPGRLPPCCSSFFSKPILVGS